MRNFPKGTEFLLSHSRLAVVKYMGIMVKGAPSQSEPPCLLLTNLYLHMRYKTFMKTIEPHMLQGSTFSPVKFPPILA